MQVDEEPALGLDQTILEKDSVAIANLTIATRASAFDGTRR